MKEERERKATYSVKYLGIVNDKIGILSKRVSMVKTFQDYPIVSAEVRGDNAAMGTQPKPPLPSAVIKAVTTSHKIPSTSGGKSKVVKEQAKAEAVQKPEEKKGAGGKEPDSEAEQEFGGEIEQCAPITTMSINSMFKASNYLKENLEKPETPLREAYEPENSIDKQAEPVQKQRVKSEEAVKEKDLAIANEPKAEKARPEENATEETKQAEPKRVMASNEKTYPSKEECELSKINERNAQSQHTVQPNYTPQTLNALPAVERFSVTDKEFNPCPEKYDQPLIHSYFFPRALPVYRRVRKSGAKDVRVLGEIADSAGNAKGRAGFRGAKFCYNEVQKIKQSLAKTRLSPFLEYTQEIHTADDNKDVPFVKARKIPVAKSQAGRQANSAAESNSYMELLKDLNIQTTGSTDSLAANNSLINKILKEENDKREGLEMLDEAEELEISGLSVSRAEEKSRQVLLHATPRNST